MFPGVRETIPISGRLPGVPGDLGPLGGWGNKRLQKMLDVSQSPFQGPSNYHHILRAGAPSPNHQAPLHIGALIVSLPHLTFHDSYGR